MGLDMELEFEKYCVVDGSPKTVLPSYQHCTKVRKLKPECGNDLLIRNADLTDISFHHCPSVSCTSISRRTNVVEADEVIKRGSVYQSSNEVRKMVGRKKNELSLSNSTGFSFGIVDSLCNSDDDNSLVEQNRSSLVSLSSESQSGGVSSDGFLESSLYLDERENRCAEYAERESVEEPKSKCDPSVSPLSDSNELVIRDPYFALNESRSSKLALPHSPSRPKSDCSKPNSPKTHFSPIRKMFDPFVKYKSQRSPLVISRNKTLRKSLLRDFSNTWHAECDNFLKKECVKPSVPSSTAHIHGLLKSENKHGVPFFEFSVHTVEDALVAKRWKVGNALNWVYTFHAISRKRKSSAAKDSSMVGQMQVSGAGAFNNSTVTEFVLYDTLQARKNITNLENPCESIGRTRESEELSDITKLKPQPKPGSGDSSNTHPWAQAELRPDLEIAAVVIQFPFEKKEKAVSDCLRQAKVNVVTPCGKHSLPTTESGGPSPLLERWRLGGKCDCGGWDSGCPLIVFDNPNIQYAEDHLLIENQQPFEVFVQGTKEKTPALTMTVTKEGQYAVDFHSQLTTLQAFSICIAILHGMVTSIVVEQERDEKLLQCDSRRLFIGEEVKYLIEAVTDEEKMKASKKVEEIPPSFVLNPPFSPISRA